MQDRERRGPDARSTRTSSRTAHLVPRCCGAFTPSTLCPSHNEVGGSFSSLELFRVASSVSFQFVEWRTTASSRRLGIIAGEGTTADIMVGLAECAVARAGALAKSVKQYGAKDICDALEGVILQFSGRDGLGLAR